MSNIQVHSDDSTISKEIRKILPEVSDFEITVEQVMHAQGSNATVLLRRKPAMYTMTEKAIQEVLKKADPKLFFVSLPITKKDHISVYLNESIRLRGETIDRAIRPADTVIASIFTLGSAVEEEVSLLFREDPAFALAMDTAASYFIDRIGSVLCQAVELFVKTTGEKTGIPISPGTKDWDVQTGQPQIFSLFSDFELPVTLNPSGMMTPQKSMSMLVPFGVNMSETGKPCDFCSMSATCKFKEVV